MNLSEADIIEKLKHEHKLVIKPKEYSLTSGERYS